MTADAIREKLSELNPEAILADGLDGALVGIAEVHGRHLAIYDTHAVVQILHERDGMDLDEAEEFFWFNVVGAYVGPNTPIFHAFQWEVISPGEVTEAAADPPENVA